MLRRLLPLSFTVLLACGGALDDGLSPNDASWDSDNTENTDTDPVSAYAGPTYWGLGGELAVTGGAVDAAVSAVTATFYDDRGQPWISEDLEGPACMPQILDAVDGPEVAEDDAQLSGWWRLALETEVDTPCPWTIPTPDAAGDTELEQVIVGFGALDPRLAASMAAADLDPDLPVYGLYSLQPGPDGDRVFVFGVAGTQAMFAGTDTPVDEPPPADGAYALQTLLLLPVPEASQE